MYVETEWLPWLLFICGVQQAGRDTLSYCRLGSRLSSVFGVPASAWSEIEVLVLSGSGSAGGSTSHPPHLPVADADIARENSPVRRVLQQANVESTPPTELESLPINTPTFGTDSVSKMFNYAALSPGEPQRLSFEPTHVSEMLPSPSAPLSATEPVPQRKVLQLQPVQTRRAGGVVAPLGIPPSTGSVPPLSVNRVFPAPQPDTRPRRTSVTSTGSEDGVAELSSMLQEIVKQ
jgi:hypothetical protein